MGSSNETSRLRRRWSRPGAATGSDSQAGAGRLVGRLGRGGRGAPLPRRHRDRHRRLDPPARRLHRHGRHQADLRPLLALGHRGLRLLARPGRARSPAPCATARSCCARWPGTTRRTPPPSTCRCRTSRRRSARGVKGLTHRHSEGIPARRHAGRDRGALGRRARAWLKAAGAEIVEVSLPHTKYALPAYYIVAPAEASSNLARYDGVRYGLRVPGKRHHRASTRTPAPRASAARCKRRIMIGTYVLSAGYYDAYYVRAQKIRTLIKRDFEEAYADGRRRDPDARDAVGRLRHRREGLGRSGRDVPNDVFTVTVNMAGLPGIAVPAGLDAPGPAARAAAHRPAVRRGDAVRRRAR